MYKIRTYNTISAQGLDKFSREHYEVASDIPTPDAVMLRSHVLKPEELPSSVCAIGRAGAGTNNIPVSYCTEKGVVVFNSPGANANAVKELVLTGMLLSSRGIVEGMMYVNGLDKSMDAKAMSTLLEAEKKRFKGNEIQGKTLGVVGLGAIGSLVANMALNLGMDVLGYDPALSVEAAWRLPSAVQRMENLATLMGRADFITLHLPMIPATEHLINADMLALVKPGARLLNFAREGVIDTQAVINSLDRQQLGRYICDFPTPALLNRNDVIAMPHIGASTKEAEDNCAMMVANQLKAFLEDGNIVNSVNFPGAVLERNDGVRLTISNTNVPKILSSVLVLLAEANINVVDMLNKSRQDIAYNIIDIDCAPSGELLNQIRDLQGVITVRLIA